MIDALYPQYQFWAATGAVWIVSDTHFDDPDCKYMNPNWPSPEEWIKKWKPHIGNYDTIIHLGDVGNMEWFDKFNCWKVLITGNHDRGYWACKEYFDEVYTGPVFIGNRILLSHEPIYGLEDFAFNIHGHVHCASASEPGHLNLAGDNCNWTPLNLGIAIKNGLLANTKNYHKAMLEKRLKQKSEEALNEAN